MSCLAPRTLLSFMLAVALSATALPAASGGGARPDAEKPLKSLLDVKIMIPREPDARDNGCRMRTSPTERQTGAPTEVPFWSLVEHANLIYPVRLTVNGPDKLASLLAPLDKDARTLALLFV